MYEKMYTLFLRKKVRIEKNEIHLQQLPHKKSHPLINKTFSKCSAPPINLKKNRSPTNLRTGQAQKTKHSIVPRVPLHILLYVSTVYTGLEVKDTHYVWGSC